MEYAVLRESLLGKSIEEKLAACAERIAQGLDLYNEARQIKEGHAQAVEAAWTYICELGERQEITAHQVHEWKANLQQQYGDRLAKVSCKGEKARLRQEASDSEIKKLWQNRGVHEFMQALGFTHRVPLVLIEKLCGLAKEKEFDAAVAIVEEAMITRAQKRPGTVMQLTTEDVPIPNNDSDVQATVDMKPRRGRKRKHAPSYPQQTYIHPASEQVRPRPPTPLMRKHEDREDSPRASVGAGTEGNSRASIASDDGHRDASQEPDSRHHQDDDTSGNGEQSVLPADEGGDSPAHGRKRFKSTVEHANESELDHRDDASPSNPGNDSVGPAQTPSKTPPSRALSEQEEEPSVELGRGGVSPMTDLSPSLMTASGRHSVAGAVAVGSDSMLENSPYQLPSPHADSGFHSEADLPFDTMIAVVLPSEPGTPSPCTAAPPNTCAGAIASLRDSEWLSTTAMEMVLDRLPKTDLLILDPSYLDATKSPAMVSQKQHLKHLALYNKILCPLHHGDHWTIVLVHLKQGQMNWYDPLRTDGHYRQAKRTLTAFGQLLSGHEEVDNKMEWTIQCVDENVQQDDQMNCGVFCLIWALAQVRDGAMPSSIVSSFWRRLFRALIDDNSRSSDLGATAAASLPLSHCAVSTLREVGVSQTISALLDTVSQHTGPVLDSIRREKEALQFRRSTVEGQVLCLTQALLLLDPAHRIAADVFKGCQSQVRTLETQRDDYLKLENTLHTSSIGSDRGTMEDILATGRRKVERNIEKARQTKLGYDGWERAKQFWEAERQQLEAQVRTFKEEGAKLRRLVEEFLTRERDKHAKMLLEVKQLSTEEEEDEEVEKEVQQQGSPGSLEL